jgi:drug/metabolite transporter (DMT)-like permease
MLILPAFLLVIGLFAVWTGWRALRIERPGLGWIVLIVGLAFVTAAIFLFWALQRVSAMEALGR